MPRWLPPDRGDASETWRWVDDRGYPIATVSRAGDLWEATSAVSGLVGRAADRSGATAMLSYDRQLGTARRSDAYNRRLGEAQRVVALRTLGFTPEEGDPYAADTGELVSWARERKTSAELDAEVEAYLLEQSAVRGGARRGSDRRRPRRR